MKRKILLGLIVSMLICGTAYAANLWGTYKGRQIVQLVVDGTVIKNSVPAQILDQTTMVPLRVVSEALGASVAWDSKQQRVTVTTPPEPVQEPVGLSLAQLNKIGESVGLVYQLDAQGRQIGTGSAFVTDGIAVTNNHVADGEAVSLRIDFGQKQFTVRVADAVFKSVEKDLIGFKVEGIPGLTLQTKLPKYKDHVYSIGYPKGRFTLGEGELLLAYDQSYTHTAFTDSGSSGGVLLNINGEVLGVIDSGADTMELNGAIPASTLKDELDKL